MLHTRRQSPSWAAFSSGRVIASCSEETLLSCGALGAKTLCLSWTLYCWTSFRARGPRASFLALEVKRSDSGAHCRSQRSRDGHSGIPLHWFLPGLFQVLIASWFLSGGVCALCSTFAPDISPDTRKLPFVLINKLFEICPKFLFI